MIRVNNLKKTYGFGAGSSEEVLHGLSFELPRTGFVCILGRSGSGKTSLLNAMGGLDVFDGGSLEIDGAKIAQGMSGEMERKRNENFGYIFQNYYLMPEHSVSYNVYLGLHSLDLTERQKMERVGKALKEVDMFRFRKRLVSELSGGQQQRVAIARAVAKAPKVVFADEPTGNLDEESTLNVCSLLKKLSRKSLVVMVTHEERLADFFADRIIRLEEGRIVGDTTEWERGVLTSADKNSVYAGDYSEQKLMTDGMTIRVLSSEGAAPANITLVIEDGKLILKTDGPWLVMHSKASEPPFVREGNRPQLKAAQFAGDDEDKEADDAALPQKEYSRSGLGFKMLWSEFKTAASRKKLKNAASGLFLVLLTLTLLLSASDILSAARVRPEDFITADSHVLEFKFDKGPGFTDKYTWTLSEFEARFLEHLEQKGLDMDLIPDTAERFRFVSSVLPQYGSLSMSLGKYNIVSEDRLDSSALLYGRMPERYDEIVVDRWVIRNCTSTDGIVQNLIPDNEYMIGKRVSIGRKNYYPVIVGICDSGEPSIYMPRAGMLSVGVHGIEAIPYSDFVLVTGRTDIEPVRSGEAVVIGDNVGSYYMKRIGSAMSLQNGMDLFLREAVYGSGTNDGIFALMIIADEDVEPMLRKAVETVTHFSVWFSDREAAGKALSEPLPEELEGVLKIDVNDTYGREYASFMSRRSVRLQTRFVITAAAGLLCLAMLYVIQRFRVRDRMDMITVYRLLGIPGRDAVAVFVLENLLMTLKYALPTVFLAWTVVTLLPVLGVSAVTIEIPAWMAFATLGLVALMQTIVAVLPVLRLLKLPPARLAGLHDF
ncbi:MAG: ATP-binding cassette domain-containing protein [Lachnospiraceae bacterium]|nr:ATP-binding cassette domain-containing protein [Lachnospiraceae bacterium]